jgi:hypothetical protein
MQGRLEEIRIKTWDLQKHGAKWSGYFNYQINFSLITFNNICEMVYGLHRKVYDWAYINQALLQINMAENQNCLSFHF